MQQTRAWKVYNFFRSAFHSYCRWTELAGLSSSSRSSSSLLLRQRFLDPLNRYFVYSTHLYLSVDSAVDALGIVKTFQLICPLRLILPSYVRSRMFVAISLLRKYTITAEYRILFIYCSKLMVNDLCPHDIDSTGVFIYRWDFRLYRGHGNALLFSHNYWREWR
jgi:hypothetical protein